MSFRLLLENVMKEIHKEDVVEGVLHDNISHFQIKFLVESKRDTTL